MKSQSKQILEHLQTGKILTPIQALNQFGCFRLAARIHDLRSKGHQIQTEILKTNSNKEIAVYSMAA